MIGSVFVVRGRERGGRVVVRLSKMMHADGWLRQNRTLLERNIMLCVSVCVCVVCVCVCVCMSVCVRACVCFASILICLCQGSNEVSYQFTFILCTQHPQDMVPAITLLHQLPNNEGYYGRQ